MPVLRWPGATARYSHFRVPVETGTPPRRRRKVRSAPFPPDGENCARSLAPPLQIEPAYAGLRFGWRLRRRIRENVCKVRSAPFPPGGENCARSLAPPLQTGPACAGLRFGWRLRRRLGEKRPGLGKSKSWDRTGAQTRAGTGDAYSGKIRPSPARGSPRRRCPQ